MLSIAVCPQIDIDLKIVIASKLAPTIVLAKPSHQKLLLLS